VVWGSVVAIVVVTAAIWLSLFRALAFRTVPLGWKLLSLSGGLFVLLGIAFILSWEPTAGPYVVDQVYPFGSYLNTWIVSLGFTMVPFGLLFAGLALLAAQVQRRAVWVTLLFSWLMFWFPHVVVIASLLVDGAGETAVAGGPETIVIGVGGLVYLGVVGAGFFLSGQDYGTI